MKDLDFGHVIRSFNRCADADLKTLLRTFEQMDGLGRKVVVEFEPTNNVKCFTDRLQRWINRFVRPAKKGTGIFVEHRVVSQSMNDMNSFKEIVGAMRRRYEDKRRLDELKRMFTEVERAMMAWCNANRGAHYYMGGQLYIAY